MVGKKLVFLGKKRHTDKQNQNKAVAKHLGSKYENPGKPSKN